jgi:outer membrane protein TolC
MSLTASLLSLALAAAGQNAPVPPPAASAAAPATTPMLRLTVEDVVSRGLEHNLGALLSASQVAAARAAELRALSDLRPHFEATVGGGRQKINLESYGLSPPPGESPLVGPFDVVDERLKATYTVFDLAAGRTARAARERGAAARLDAAAARDLVVLACGNLYLSVLAEQGRLTAADARVATAEAVAALARNREQQGSASALDTLRADVERQRARERRILAGAEEQKARLALARAIGLPSGTAFELADALTYKPLNELPFARMLAIAESTRGDVGAARARLTAAESDLAAAKAGVWPVLGVAADIGLNGPPGGLETTYSTTVGVRIPLWEGGRTAAKVAAAAAAVDARRAELADLERAAEQDLRGALLDLGAAGSRVEVVGEGRVLAARELEVARDRFTVGLASTLDVVAAQESVAAAEESWLDAIYQHSVGKAKLARALGIAEEAFTAILNGTLEVAADGNAR